MVLYLLGKTQLVLQLSQNEIHTGPSLSRIVMDARRLVQIM